MNATAVYSTDVILETRDLCKSFAGFVAVNAVSLKVRRGQIHALIGPNGAGKSTVFNLLTKFLPPSHGAILFNGVDITRESAAQTARRGLGRSFQISAVFPRMSVAENVRVAVQSRLGTAYRFWKPVRTLDVLNTRVMQLLGDVGLESAARKTAGSLPYGQKRALEIATTLALDPEMLLLDEPTQGMGHEDVHRVTDLIQRVAQHRTVLMVEHNMNVVARIADTITVLQRGSVIAEGAYAAVSSDPAVIEAYMGTRQNQQKAAA